MAETLVLRRSRWRAFLLLSTCAAFVALLAWLPDVTSWKWWLGIVVFGLGCPVALLLLVSSRIRLEIADEGLTRVTLRRSYFHRWEDCSRFEVLKLRYGFTTLTRMITFKARVADGKGGSRDKDLALTNTYGMNIEALARRLNIARERRLEALSSPAPDPKALSTRSLGVAANDRTATVRRR